MPNLLLGDSLEVLKTLPANSVDACVTDPPYGLSFMNKHWDYDVPSVELWREVFRVMKPGAHLLSFGGSRTYHRMVVAIEDAGFEIRDQVQWIYGSGFPKSHDVSKSIDREAGAVREVIGTTRTKDTKRNVAADILLGKTDRQSKWSPGSPSVMIDHPITAPATEAAHTWQGWGTALKPANEPIVLARKPLEPKLTVAANVLKHGTGAINVDASRIEAIGGLTSGGACVGESALPMNKDAGIAEKRERSKEHTQGRWPANVLFDEESAAVLDEQSGVLRTGGEGSCGDEMSQGATTFGGTRKPRTTANSSGGASRFFYVAKASRRERNAGLEGMPEKVMEIGDERPSGSSWERRDKRQSTPRANVHPTVKPIKLMEYLVRMITPPGGCVLDPFMGSGSTGCAAKRLGFQFIGCEMNAEYFEIAKKRIDHAETEAV